jgi:hypothetical protein
MQDLLLMGFAGRVKLSVRRALRSREGVRQFNSQHDRQA